MSLLIVFLFVFFSLLAYELGYNHGKHEAWYETYEDAIKNLIEEKEINERSANKREE